MTTQQKIEAHATGAYEAAERARLAAKAAERAAIAGQVEESKQQALAAAIAYAQAGQSATDARNLISIPADNADADAFAAYVKADAEAANAYIEAEAARIFARHAARVAGVQPPC